MKLNVGCGSDRWGDVRIDISKNYWMYKGKSAVNLIADAQYLPFRSKCFHELRMYQVLEHTPDWKKALCECCRVTAEKLDITIPIDSYLPRKAWMIIFSPRSLKFLIRLRQRTREHLWQFNIDKLVTVLKESGFNDIDVTKLWHSRFGFLTSLIGKYFRSVTGRFRKAHSWKIVVQSKKN